MSTCELRRSATCAAAALALCLGGVSPAADWPQYRGPNCDGSSSEQVATWPPVELWTASLGTGLASTAVVGTHVYAIGHDETAYEGDQGADTVWCIDADTGQVLWSKSYRALSERGQFGGPSTPLPPDLKTAGPRATPASDGSRVYVLSLDGQLRCLDASTGGLVWCRSVVSHLGGTLKTYGVCSSPVLYGNSMLLLDVGGALVALDRGTGDVLWRCEAGRGWACAVTPAVAVLGGTPCAVFGSRDISCARLADGALLWKLNMDREAMSSHLVAGDKVLFSTYPDGGKACLLSAGAGAPAPDWTRPDVMTYHLTNTAYGGYAFVMNNSGTEWDGHDSGADDSDNRDSSLVCLELATGNTVWTKAGLGWATAVVAGGRLLVLRETGELLSADASPLTNPDTDFQSAGPVIGQWCWTQPALSGGRLYCRNDKGKLKCLSIAPAVSIAALQPVAQETSATGLLRVRRAGDTSAALVVTISLGGSEETGEYALSVSEGSITETALTFPAGVGQVDVTVTPVADSDSDDETVTVTLVGGSGYVLGSTSSATVWILDSSAALPAVTVTTSGADKWALEGGPDVGRFVVSRGAAASWPLVVNVTVGGTAAGGEFLLRGVAGGAVTIPAGSAEAVVTVEAVDNAATDGSRTVVLTLASGATYTIGNPSSATVTIVDDDGSVNDSDGDGMDDDWELAWWGDLSQVGSGDYDHDGLTNAAEFAAGTDPTDPDTDKDGSTDGDEVAGGSDPLDPASFVTGGSSGGGGGCAPGAAGAAAAALFAGLAFALRRRGPAGGRTP